MGRRVAFVVMLVVALMLSMTVFRALFMLAYLPLAEGMSVADGLYTLVNGGAIDLSATMLVIMPVLVAVSFVWRRQGALRGVMLAYLMMTGCVLAATFAVDLVMFGKVGHRLNAASLEQLFTSESVSVVDLLTVVAVWLGAWALGSLVVRALMRGVAKFSTQKPTVKHSWPIALLWLCAVLGAGWGSARIPRYGAAYFSGNQFMNTAAVNPLMSLVESAAIKPDYSPLEILLQPRPVPRPTPEQEVVQADSVEMNSPAVDSVTVVPDLGEIPDSLELLKVDDQTPDRVVRRQMLATERPDVLIIIMNGVTRSDFDRTINGRYVMSHLNTLCSEGYLFENFYAAGVGVPNSSMVAVTGGYLTLPGAASQDIPFKCERMITPLAQLDSAGYHSEVWYGGDLLHNNMRAYLYGTGFDNVVDVHKLPLYGVVSAVDDAVVLPKVANRLIDSDQRFMCVVATTGMEPGRRLPYVRYDDPRNNAAAFVDEQIGVMVRQLKYGGVWDNLLMIVVGDSDGTEERVPMMIVGGAVEGFGVVSRVGSQVDIPVTLASQMGFATDLYPFGSDLSMDADRTVCFVYEGGYGVADDQGCSKFTYDKSDWGSPTLDIQRHTWGQEFLRHAYQELQNR